MVNKSNIKIAFISIWLITVIISIFLLYNNVRELENYQILRYALQTIYVLGLLSYLLSNGETNLIITGDTNISTSPMKYLGLIFFILISILILFTNFGILILLLSLVIAALLIFIIKRKEIRIINLILGVALTIIGLVAGWPHMQNGFIPQTFFFALLIFVPFMFVSAGIINKNTKICKMHLIEYKYSQSVKNFLIGALTFIPLGLFNAASGSPGNGMDYISNWGMVFTLPLFSGITEEIWYRLFLITFLYFVLLPFTKNRPKLIVTIVILFSAISFGLSHGRSIESFLITGLLYGLPLALIFIRKNLEQAIGGHYMINLIPTLMVFLEARR